MSHKKTAYIAKEVDSQGFINYTEEENAVWHDLITEQTKSITKYACEEYLHGLQLLQLPSDRIPQCYEVSAILKKMTGWELEPVPALIPFEQFFHLLANRRFPAATFIRRREELHYLQEPDMFHEIFGHCPLLTNEVYANFTQTYGKLGLAANQKDRVMLFRLFWFTIEFGLINTGTGLRAYGGGILSSINETLYSIESNVPQRKPFDVIEVLRTPYRIDIVQPIYYVLNDFDTLFELIDLISLIQKARELGDIALM